MRLRAPGALLCLSAALCQASTFVVPNSLAGVEGNTNNCLPFGCGPDRYQQVFAASQFGSGGGSITQIAFRPDGNTGAAFSSTISSIRIDLSTTSQAPDGLSTTFASNVGLDDTIVFNGSLSISSTFTGPAGGPKTFDIVINLTTPFAYNPSLGNLLLDVTNFSGSSGVSSFDAENAVGDSISRVFSLTAGAAAGTADSFGLVTQFTTSVPEPGTLALLSLGGLVFAGWRLRRGRA